MWHVRITYPIMFSIPFFIAHQLCSEAQLAQQQAQATAVDSDTSTDVLRPSIVVATSPLSLMEYVVEDTPAQEKQTMLMMKMISSLLTFHMNHVQVCLQ